MSRPIFQLDRGSLRPYFLRASGDARLKKNPHPLIIILLEPPFPLAIIRALAVIIMMGIISSYQEPWAFFPV